MKKIFVVIASLIIFFVFSSTVHAATQVTPGQCAAQGGHCITAIMCAGGPPITPNDCSTGQRCCPNSGSCTHLGGTCITTVMCANGPAINADDCGLQRCCPTAAPSTGGGNTDLTKCKNGSDGIQTAIGCIRVFDQTTFLSDILKWAVGIGGGIAFLLIIYAGFMIMTGAGNPERLKAGQELLTSALSGLILLVLSIFVLKFIGIDILGLGAFGFGATPTP